MNSISRILGLLLCIGIVATNPDRALNAQEPPAAAGKDTLESHLGRGYEALKQENYEAAENEFRAALAIDPKLDMRARFPLAVSLFEQHKTKESRQELETVRKSSGDLAGISYYLGRIDLDEHDFKGAIANLSKAAAQPPFPDTSFFLGLAYSKQGLNRDAEKWLKEAVKVNPDDSRAAYQLATLYRKEGREAEASEAFQRAKDIKAQNDKRSQLRFQCAQELDRGVSENANAVCERLNNPDDAELLTTLGTLYGQHGQLERAVAPLQRAAELAPQSPQMQYNLAFTYYRLQRYELARAALQPAVQRWPDLFPVNALYGAVLLELNQIQPAYEALRQAHQLNPQDTIATGLLFRAAMAMAEQQEKTGSVASAVPYLEEAATLAPAEPGPHRRLAAIYRQVGKPDQAHEEDQKAGNSTNSANQ